MTAEVVSLPTGQPRLREEHGARAWCSVGLHEFCSETAQVKAPCECAKTGH